MRSCAESVCAQCACVKCTRSHTNISHTHTAHTHSQHKTMDFRAFVGKSPNLTIPRQRTLVYGGKLLFSNAAAKIPKAISQKRHDGFSFLTDENLEEIRSISSRSRVLAHRPCPKLEMFCPSVLQLFYGCSKVLMTNHGMCFLFLFLCFSNRLEIRAQLP